MEGRKSSFGAITFMSFFRSLIFFQTVWHQQFDFTKPTPKTLSVAVLSFVLGFTLRMRGTSRRRGVTSTAGAAPIGPRWRHPLALAVTWLDLGLLLVLDSAVLEPDFHLFLRQIEIGGDLDSAQAREVHVGGELSFELEKLRAREGCSDPLAAGEVILV